MPVFNNPTQTARQILGAGALLLYATFAFAEGTQALRERQRLYQNDRQRCLSGQTEQNQASCLQEAGAVLQQPQSVQDQVDTAQLAENALQRCNALAGDERQSCISRMQGQGSVHGSAASGGILRELSEPAQ